MTEQELRGFIGVVTEYFRTVAGKPADLGLPYIKAEREETLAYTGLIGITGRRRGAVYLTAGADLLERIAGHILGPGGLTDADRYDLIGEMANTVAGNMRELFGAGFGISVPMVVRGPADDIALLLKPPVYVIPLAWEGCACRLVIGLE
jgi:chemotaxis protein CheX